jgi:D-alanyl-D-alanine carboxypeptidase
MTDAESMRADLDVALRAAVASGAPGAVGLLARADETHLAAAGVADLATGESMAPASRFGIGSVSKTFLATLVLALADDGALALDDPVAGHLPGELHGADGITIRHLLQHTSGLADYFTPDVLAKVRADPLRAWDPRELVSIAAAEERVTAPGEAFSYSNANYLVAGLIVEAVTERAVHDVMHSRLLDPLGLSETTLPVASRRDEAGPIAHGYFPAGNPIIPSPADEPVDGFDLHPSFSWTAGAMASSAPALSRFLALLLAAEILSEDATEDMVTTVRSDWPESEAYGLGLQRVESVFGFVSSSCGPAWGPISVSVSTPRSPCRLVTAGGGPYSW